MRPSSASLGVLLVCAGVALLLLFLAVVPARADAVTDAVSISCE